MKPHHKIFLTSLALLLVVINAHCQTKIIEGRIVYEIKYIDSAKVEMPDTLYTKQRVFWFKGDKQRTEDIIDGKVRFTILFSSKTWESITLLNSTGKNVASIYKMDNLDEDLKHQVDMPLKYLNETKMICGFKCNKALCARDSNRINEEVYFTKDIFAPYPYDLKYMLKGLNGFPMEYHTHYGGLETVYTIINISFEKVDDNEFEIPKGCKIENLEKKSK